MELLVVFSLLYFSFSFYIVIDTDCLVGFCGLHCRRRLFQAQMHTKEFRGYISCGGSISSIPIPNLSDGVMEGNLQYSSVTGYAYNFRSIDYLYNLLTQLLTEFINREKGGKSRYTRRMKRELTTSPLRERVAYLTTRVNWRVGSPHNVMGKKGIRKHPLVCGKKMKKETRQT